MDTGARAFVIDFVAFTNAIKAGTLKWDSTRMRRPAGDESADDAQGNPLMVQFI